MCQRTEGEGVTVHPTGHLQGGVAAEGTVAVRIGRRPLRRGALET